MNDLPEKLRERADRKTRKRDEKKRQIAQSAISALKELGYANTGLRDIAAKSDLSLGMLHYYFEDRSDLIIYCVRIYKHEFVRAITQAVEHAQGRDEVAQAFAEALAVSIIRDEETHRLWYDIRTQAMFDAAFRPAVAEIEALLINAVRIGFDKAGTVDPADESLAYAMIDGAFRYLMQGQIGPAARDQATLSAIFREILARFL